MIKQGDSESEFIICFGTFKLSVALKQLLKVITVLGLTFRHVTAINYLWNNTEYF